MSTTGFGVPTASDPPSLCRSFSKRMSRRALGLPHRNLTLPGRVSHKKSITSLSTYIYVSMHIYIIIHYMARRHYILIDLLYPNTSNCYIYIQYTRIIHYYSHYISQPLYIYTHIYINICLYHYIFISIYIYIHTCMHACMHTYRQTDRQMCIYIYIYIFQISTHTHIYIYI